MAAAAVADPKAEKKGPRARLRRVILLQSDRVRNEDEREGRDRERDQGDEREGLEHRRDARELCDVRNKAQRRALVAVRKRTRQPVTVSPAEDG